MHGTLTHLREDAQLTLARVASRGEAVDAARAALRTCITSHGEHKHIDVVTRLMTATREAGDGVAAVRRKALACLDYADAHPQVVLGPDGAVTVAPTASGTGAGGTPPTADGSTADAGQAQAQAAELSTMVSSTLALADQVDADYTQSLTMVSSSAQPASSAPDSSSSDRADRADDPDTLASRGGRLVPYGGRRPSKDGEEGGSSDDATGLGDPVPGEHADMPGVDPWQYPGDSDNEGSGQYRQRPPTPRDYAVHEAATLAAGTCASMWPDASKNLYHYLQNTGSHQDMDVDGMLNDLPSLDNDTQTAVTTMAGQAVDDAQASGYTGPMTYPFNTPWEHADANPIESENWFYATGGYQRATDGTITVYPPTDGNSEWTYSYDYRVHTADRYNWDGDKSTEIFGMTITDKELQELHRAGLAQEYDMSGESSVRHGTGP
ncbi:hypothetical protein [Actinomyces gerencseriae]|uniref:hypothetical protein n=1 Tax=Actinomyces gerencseriae TaxID=52769 RepID=UPI0028E46B0E|nr:hypothetical protein [Actinomyces gerencseriae]